MADPLISVLMATHNYGQFIGQAIESILGQTYDNFELIIIDDASTDNTLEVIDRFCDHRIVLVRRTECSCSPDGVRNEGLAIAQGDLIAIADSDDVSLPYRFQKQVGFFRHNPDIDLLGGAIVRINAEGIPFTDPISKPHFKAPSQYRQALLQGDNIIFNPTMMYRRHVLDNVQGYRYYTGSGDKEFLLRASRYHNLCNMRDVLVFYRRHHASASLNSGAQLRGFHHKVFLLHEYLWLQNEVLQLTKKEKYG